MNYKKSLLIISYNNTKEGILQFREHLGQKKDMMLHIHQRMG